jgi:hypothetical protein
MAMMVVWAVPYSSPVFVIYIRDSSSLRNVGQAACDWGPASTSLLRKTLAHHRGCNCVGPPTAPRVPSEAPSSISPSEDRAFPVPDSILATSLTAFPARRPAGPVASAKRVFEAGGVSDLPWVAKR